MTRTYTVKARIDGKNIHKGDFESMEDAASYAEALVDGECEGQDVHGSRGYAYIEVFSCE